MTLLLSVCYSVTHCKKFKAPHINYSGAREVVGAVSVKVTFLVPFILTSQPSLTVSLDDTCSLIFVILQVLLCA